MAIIFGGDWQCFNGPSTGHTRSWMWRYTRHSTAPLSRGVALALHTQGKGAAGDVRARRTGATRAGETLPPSFILRSSCSFPPLQSSPYPPTSQLPTAPVTPRSSMPPPHPSIAPHPTPQRRPWMMAPPPTSVIHAAAARARTRASSSRCGGEYRGEVQVLKGKGQRAAAAWHV